MPKFKVRRTWSETYYYDDTVEIEADTESEALDLASEQELNYTYGPSGSEYDDGSLDCEIEEEVKVKQTTTRNLPNWF